MRAQSTALLAVVLIVLLVVAALLLAAALLRGSTHQTGGGLPGAALNAAPESPVSVYVSKLKHAKIDKFTNYTLRNVQRNRYMIGQINSVKLNVNHIMTNVRSMRNYVKQRRVKLGDAVFDNIQQTTRTFVDAMSIYDDEHYYILSEVNKFINEYIIDGMHILHTLEPALIDDIAIDNLDVNPTDHIFDYDPILNELDMWFSKLKKLSNTANPMFDYIRRIIFPVIVYTIGVLNVLNDPKIFTDYVVIRGELADIDDDLEVLGRLQTQNIPEYTDDDDEFNQDADAIKHVILSLNRQDGLSALGFASTTHSINEFAHI